MLQVRLQIRVVMLSKSMKIQGKWFFTTVYPYDNKSFPAIVYSDIMTCETVCEYFEQFISR